MSLMGSSTIPAVLAARMAKGVETCLLYTSTDIRDEFKTCNVYAKPGCKDCFARFYCSGGCAANAYNFSGSINGAYEIGCEMQKKRIECAIMIKAALADDEE